MTKKPLPDDDDSLNYETRVARGAVCGRHYVGMKWRCALPAGHSGDCDYHKPNPHAKALGKLSRAAGERDCERRIKMDSAMEQMVSRMLIQTCSSVRTKVRAIPYISLKQKKAIEEIVEELNEAIDQSCRVFQDAAQ